MFRKHLRLFPSGPWLPIQGGWTLLWRGIPAFQKKRRMRLKSVSFWRGFAEYSRIL